MLRQQAQLPSFIAGLLTASLVWSLGWATRRIFFPRINRPSELALDRSGDDDDDESDDESRSSIVEDVNSSLPSFKMYSSPLFRKQSVRWPWDKLRNSMINAASASFRKLEHASSKTTAINKTGYCIGEIFGLDVGGSLTKLVYFEQQIEEYKRRELHEGLHRREHYAAAASALEVLQVRRSASTNHLQHNSDSDENLQGLWGLRQQSEPDSLNQFASSCNLNGASLFTTDRIKGEGLSNMQHRSEEQLPSNYEPSSGMGTKRSLSMINLTKSPEHVEALDNFYSFARRLDTYETAVKDKYLSYYSKYLNGTFHFIRFETRRMDHAINLIRYTDFHLNIKKIGATGGGAHKYANDWERELGIELAKQDEMDSLVAGMQFVMMDSVNEVYTFKPTELTEPQTENATSLSKREGGFIPNASALDSTNEESHEYGVMTDVNDTSPLSPQNDSFKPTHIDQWWTSKKVHRNNVIASNLYPYLLVNIGTGVSILRVDGPREHERISGSTIGGGTYWGLCRLLTGSDSFRDVLDLAMKGDPSKVDMMVGDIYGKNSNALEKIGLPSDIVASSFGKLVAKQNPSEGIKEEDLARALLLMVTNNIGQVAHLNAKLHKTRKIFFIGTFLQHNVISQQRLAYSIDYWSRGKMEAQFLEHEGYFGALGAFLLNQGIEIDGSLQGNKNDADDSSKPTKTRHTKGKLHHRSKSLGSMSSSSVG
ncbi:hypothetical protein ACHAXH_009559 [Discostella pseudostelligera]